MIMTTSRFPYLLFCILFTVSSGARLQGQFRDFQTWWELELKKDLGPSLHLEGELEQRFKNNSLQYSRSLLTLGASYDALDFLTLAGGARTVLVEDAEQRMQVRYRIHFDATGRYELSGFDLSLRGRLQYGFNDFGDFRYFSWNTPVIRSRLKVARHIFGTGFDWFALVESWHGTRDASRWITFALRYSAGIAFEPGFRSRFSLRYILEDEVNMPDPVQLHVLVAGYSYEF